MFYTMDYFQFWHSLVNWNSEDLGGFIDILNIIALLWNYYILLWFRMKDFWCPIDKYFENEENDLRFYV